jgi:hypothetical protein
MWNFFSVLVFSAGFVSCGITKVNNSSNTGCATQAGGKNTQVVKGVVALAVPELALNSPGTGVQFENLNFVGGVISSRVIEGGEWANQDWPNYKVTSERTQCSALFRLFKETNGYKVLVQAEDVCSDSIAVRGKEIQIDFFGKSDTNDFYGYESFAARSEIADQADAFYKGAVGVHPAIKGEFYQLFFTNPLINLAPHYPKFYKEKTELIDEEKLAFGKEYCQTFGDSKFKKNQKIEECQSGFHTRYYNFFIDSAAIKGREKFLSEAAERSQNAYKSAREKFAQQGNSPDIEAALAYEQTAMNFETHLKGSLLTKYFETIVNTVCPYNGTDKGMIEICKVSKKKIIEISAPFIVNPEVKAIAEKLISTNFASSSVQEAIALRNKYKDLRISSGLAFMDSIGKTHKLVAANLNSLAFATNYTTKLANGKPALYFDVKKLPTAPGSHLGTLHYESKGNLIYEVEGANPSNEFRTRFTSGKVLFLNGLPLWSTSTSEKQNGGASLLPLPQRSGGASGSQVPAKGSGGASQSCLL